MPRLDIYRVLVYIQLRCTSNLSSVFSAGYLLSPVDRHLWLGSSKGELRHPVETSTNGHKIKGYQLLGEA
jgi:hypothetical protein